MQETSLPSLSVNELFAQRDARLEREKEAREQLAHKKEEDLAKSRNRLDEFQLTDVYTQKLMEGIRRAFERGEPELMIVSFPSNFCTDGGRAIENAGEPPINKASKQDAAKHPEPEWLHTLPKGALPLYEYWKNALQPGGFGLSGRIISYPGGMPGDVGLFITWPRSILESQPSASQGRRV
jgi:hypothetical protein